MGCCETRDMNEKRLPLPIYFKNQLKSEVEFLDIAPLSIDFHKLLYDSISYINNIQQVFPWTKNLETSDITIESYENSKYCAEFPIISIKFETVFYITLQQIIQALTKFETRKKWDKNLVSLEYIDKSEHFLRSVYQYPIVKAEFIEEKFIAYIDDIVLLGLNSVELKYKKTEDAARCLNYFSVYCIKEVDERSAITIYLHINPMNNIALIGKKIAYKLIAEWAKSLRIFLENSVKQI